MKEDTSEDKNSQKDLQNSNLQDVKSNYLFRKTSSNNTFNKLNDIININKNKNSGYNYSPNESYDSLLLKTCKVVGNVEKIKFTAGFKNASSQWNPLKKILRASNIRSRKVFLENNWWLHDHGPFLGFLREDKTPIAIIRKNKKYYTDNIKTGKNEVVNDINSSKIETIAHSFFTPLPEGKLSKKTLLKFILGFTRNDIIFFLVLGVLGALLSLFNPVLSAYIFNVIIP